MDTIKIQSLLEQFGLTEKESEVYQQLHKKPWLTVVELATTIDIPRPTLYRILEDLKKQGLVETNVDHKTTYYAVAPLEALQSKILESEEKTKKLKEAFKQLHILLPVSVFTNQSETKISFYRGRNGIQSLEWEQSQLKNEEMLVFGHDIWWKYVGSEFAEEVREERVKNNIKTREILNPESKPPTENWTRNQVYKKQYYQVRFIDRKTLPINNEIMMYASAIYILSLNENEVIGIKLQSPSLAKLFRALFEIMWKEAKKN